VLLTMRERRKFEDELIAARKAVEETAKAKDEFVAMVSHELRTPLTAITGWLHILQEGATDPETVRESVEVIERNALMQRQLIEDLLDFSRITAGKLRLDVAYVDLHTVVRNAIDVVRPAVDAKGIRLSSILDPNAGPITGDANRLQQVIWNLLSNAVKFTPKNGKILIQLRRANSHAELLISDTGVGIDPEFLPFVFERFRQEDNSRTRRYGGLGLGLAITKEIVELHGGTIQARSAGCGLGSSFELHFPIPSVQAGIAASSGAGVPTSHQELGETAQTSETDHKTQPLSHLRIVAVDDVAESLEVIARILRKAGAEVETAASAEAAMELLTSRLPDLLVADLGMPDVDGFELLRRIRASDGPLRSLTAIALSALVTDADRLRAIEVGFQAFISKPVTPKELVLTVLNLSRIRPAKTLTDAIE
jgi:CheY-like chemotaxis protein